MLKRFIWVAIATLFFALQLPIGSAAAYELSEEVRTVPLNDKGDTVVLSTKQLDRGRRLFNDSCAKCHAAGRTKTNPNITLAADSLAGAEPPRDNLTTLVDYLIHPTSYDGELDLTELHPNKERSDIWTEMRNLTQEDLKEIAGHILIQPKIQGVKWGGGKVYN
ncbi:MAG: photosystem II cytochrome c-550 [Oscillatoria sp. PMC 1051.18]|nr:photosystem II cytochrome c-550 [Oscillatoria sp. PMC 1050.18]MEC5030129.1 photosystem II cytochrome c-550 [Oscillatoria sp. PMC 1051.18]